ncbi:MAG TPA: tetratricopeptide repeat-containing sensor histidine kinase [Bacteroidales bacterium]|nr:tetratricopeptide repeat-containing sensor histidine kinase [Bacteroidales bacterium]
MRHLVATLVLMMLLLSLQASQPDSLLIHRMINQGSELYNHDRPAALIEYEKAISIAGSLGFFDDSVAVAMYRVAYEDYYKGNAENAITNALKALNFYKQRNNYRGMVKMMTFVGDILRGNSLYDQCYQYLYQARMIALKIADSSLIASVYNRLAASLVESLDLPYDSAEKFATGSLAIATRLKDDLLVYNNLNILGYLELRRLNYDKALDYFNKALPIVTRVYPEDEPLILINIARVYDAYAKPEAETMNLKALQMAQNMNIPKYVVLACLSLETIYVRKGDYKKAHYYSSLYYLTRSNIYEQKVLVQLQEFNTRLSEEKQRNENEELLYQQDLSASRQRTYILIGTLLILLLAGAAFFILYQRRQWKEIDRIAGQLNQSNKILMRFISIIGHDLRSPFNAILGFTDILKNDKGLTQEEKSLALDRLYTVSRSTYKLLEEILEWSRLQSGSVKPVIKTCNVTDLISETIQILEPSAILKKIQLEFEYPGPLEMNADPDMLLTIFRNLISNAVKFTQPGERVQIRLEKQDKEVSITVSDHGVGMTEEELGKLFRLDENYKSKGTGGETGSGFGLILCKEYVTLHKGKLIVTSEKGSGSAFTVHLPLT